MFAQFLRGEASYAEASRFVSRLGADFVRAHWENLRRPEVLRAAEAAFGGAMRRLEFRSLLSERAGELGIRLP